MDLPPCSLLIIQPESLPITFTSRKRNKNDNIRDLMKPSSPITSAFSKVDITSVLSIESLETILITIPKVELLPCGVSAILNLKGCSNNPKAYILFLIDMDDCNTKCQLCLEPNHSTKCLRGPALLSHLYNHLQVSGLQNVVPLGKCILLLTDLTLDDLTYLYSHVKGLVTW